MVLNVVDAFNDPFVPCGVVKVFEKADKSDTQLDEKSLRLRLVAALRGYVLINRLLTGIETRRLMTTPATTAKAACR